MNLMSNTHQMTELQFKVKKYENMLFKLGAMKKAPCFICGYNGEGYYNPSKHNCAKRHHKLQEAQ